MLKYQIFVAVFIGFFFVANVHAGIIDDLRAKINERNSEVKALEEEIEQYQEEVERVSGQARTLESAIKTLDITEQKLGTDIRLTESKITKTSLTVDALSLEISDTQKSIGQNARALGEAIRLLHELESRTLIEILLGYDSFSGFWKGVENLERFQSGVHVKVRSLKDLKDIFDRQKEALEGERVQLVALSGKLKDQKGIVDQNKEQKERLLKDTENKEANYRNLLADRLKKKEALEQEIAEFEERLRIEIDPDSLPETGTGILAWPLEQITVTQFFGTTPFATKNPQVYNGGGHNGVDLRASVGTPVLASAAGIVVDTGDTDIQCYKVSYGKWILVRHFNGLSTLYAHLSLVNVGKGQEVGGGDVLGYSGNTGYSTGPHLHFSVYASKAVQVTDEYKSRVCGTNLKLPLSARNGYLNPLSYLPPLN